VKGIGVGSTPIPRFLLDSLAYLFSLDNLYFFHVPFVPLVHMVHEKY